MPRIRCHFNDCVFLDEGYCSAAAVEIDPDNGCTTHTPSESVITEEDWDEVEDLEDWEDNLEDDLWDDEEKEF